MNKRVLELQHIDFFDREGAVLFHSLLDSARLAEYRDLFSKISITRNVWKHSELLKKLSFNHSFASIAGELIRLKRLRFGFDHFFPSFEALKTFFARGSSLNALNSIDGLEIALLLNLSTHSTSPEGLLSTLPSIGGSGTFFDAQRAPFDLSIEPIPGPFFLITYCHAHARYLYKVTDPFTHDVKKESCAFGDRLANSYHPLVYY